VGFNQRHRAFGPQDCDGNTGKASTRANVGNTQGALGQPGTYEKGLAKVPLDDFLNRPDAGQIQDLVPPLEMLEMLFKLAHLGTCELNE
jgi:hypothetical protein